MATAPARTPALPTLTAEAAPVWRGTVDVWVDEPGVEIGLEEGEGLKDEGAAGVGPAGAGTVLLTPTAGGTTVVPAGDTELGTGTGTTVEDSPTGTGTTVEVSPAGTVFPPAGTMGTVVVLGTTTAGVDVVTAVTTMVLVPVTGTLKVEVPLVVGT